MPLDAFATGPGQGPGIVEAFGQGHVQAVAENDAMFSKIDAMPSAVMTGALLMGKSFGSSIRLCWP